MPQVAIVLLALAAGVFFVWVGQREVRNLPPKRRKRKSPASRRKVRR